MDHYAERVRAAAADLAAAREEAELAKERRDEAILAARDEGHLSWNELARLTGLVRARVIAIVGGG
jgi:hypothetical protein